MFSVSSSLDGKLKLVGQSDSVSVNSSPPASSRSIELSMAEQSGDEMGDFRKKRSDKPDSYAGLWLAFRKTSK